MLNARLRPTKHTKWGNYMTNEQLERRRARRREYYAAHREEICAKQRERYRAMDKAVHAERIRRYRHLDMERTREKQRAYRAAHRERFREYNRRYYEKHREACNASGRERYALTRPERLAKKREYYAAHREELLAKKHEYYLKNRLRICRDALERYVPDAVEKIAAQCPEAVAECAARWPYEDFEPGIRRCIARLGIRPGALEYDDCFEAGMLAWLYGVHRCALMGYEHVGAYVGRVTAILVRCAAAAALETEAILAEHGLKRWELDRDGLPERY